jgi:hypothetical protein
MAASLRIAREDANASSNTNIVYKIADGFEERCAAFRLVYNSYLRAGLIDPNPHQMRVTPYHLLHTTDVFVARLQDETISTVSLVCDGQHGLPLEVIYPEEVSQLRQRGIRVAEVSALADRRRQLSRTLPVFVPLARLMIQTARARGVEQVLVAVHPRHAKFYQRLLGFEVIGSQKAYPLVSNQPAVPLKLDFDRIDRHPPVNYDSFFAEPLPREVLEPRPITAEEIEALKPAARWSEGFAVVGPDDHSSREKLENCA